MDKISEDIMNDTATTPVKKIPNFILRVMKSDDPQGAFEALSERQQKIANERMGFYKSVYEAHQKKAIEDRMKEDLRFTRTERVTLRALVGCACSANRKPPPNGKTKLCNFTMMVTFYSPSEETLEALQEGRLLQIFGALPSSGGKGINVYQKTLRNFPPEQPKFCNYVPRRLVKLCELAESEVRYKSMTGMDCILMILKIIVEKKADSSKIWYIYGTDLSGVILKLERRVRADKVDLDSVQNQKIQEGAVLGFADVKITTMDEQRGLLGALWTDATLVVQVCGKKLPKHLGHFTDVSASMEPAFDVLTKEMLLKVEEQRLENLLSLSFDCTTLDEESSSFVFNHLLWKQIQEVGPPVALRENADGTPSFSISGRYVAMYWLLNHASKVLCFLKIQTDPSSSSENVWIHIPCSKYKDFISLIFFLRESISPAAENDRKHAKYSKPKKEILQSIKDRFCQAFEIENNASSNIGVGDDQHQQKDNQMTASYLETVFHCILKQSYCEAIPEHQILYELYPAILDQKLAATNSSQVKQSILKDIFSEQPIQISWEWCEVVSLFGAHLRVPKAKSIVNL